LKEREKLYKTMLIKRRNFRSKDNENFQKKTLRKKKLLVPLFHSNNFASLEASSGSKREQYK
jgi:hypothetical protein